MKNLILAATLAWTAAAAANPICKACGREASTEDAKVCSHCQTPLPTAAAAPAPAAAAAAEPAEFKADDSPEFAAVKAEYLAAKKAESGDKEHPHPEIAFFHYHNALAMAPLAKLSDQRQREALSDSVRRSLAAVTHFEESCPACKGERTYVLNAPNVGQADGRIGSHDNWLKKKVSCPLCRGLGHFPGGYRNIARLTRALAEGRREFDTMHQAAGDVKVGYAWVPAAIAAGFTARERAVVATSYGAPCPKCGWSGLEACTVCKGEGVVKCKGQNCRNGWVEREVKQSGTGRKVTANRNKKEVFPCETCQGTALVTCENCNAARLVPCKKCQGEGLAPVCGACNGTGLVNCRKCNGSGRYRRPGANSEETECPECRGLGEVTCRGCTGLGRKSGGR